ncbi:hypothetical protein AVEN_164634-1 [Araneus ventricosus]|uniref:Uncharacterized protein n=1 Tax=Araneus ventricosus TaxID=182803 RepID=A0A4Y2QWT0_ARAVE|nr:hypothetical protein AVEN_164634-1 [Araneus ventricosus]
MILLEPRVIGGSPYITETVSTTDTLKPVIHERSTPCHSIFQSIHLDRSFTATPRKANPSAAGHSDPLLNRLLPLLQNANQILLRFPPEREIPLPHLSTQVAFQHLCPGSPNGTVGYPNFRPHRSNSRRFFALTTVLGVDHSRPLKTKTDEDWIGVERKVVYPTRPNIHDSIWTAAP